MYESRDGYASQTHLRRLTATLCTAQPRRVSNATSQHGLQQAK